MKVLIVSLGLLLVSITFVIYQGDLFRYMQLQTFLKATAEECAAGAALYYDEEAYSQGRMIIDRDEAAKYIDHLVGEASGALALSGGEELYYELEIADESNGTLFDDQSPWVEVTLRFVTPDLFRLSFLQVNHVIRSGKYELAEYGAR